MKKSKYIIKWVDALDTLPIPATNSQPFAVLCSLKPCKGCNLV